MICHHVTLLNRQGLHARPIQRIVETCRLYAATIKIARGDHQADGRSILEMLTLAAPKGTVLTITADGPDAEHAVADLVRLIASKFDED